MGSVDPDALKGVGKCIRFVNYVVLREERKVRGKDRALEDLCLSRTIIVENSITKSVDA